MQVVDKDGNVFGSNGLEVTGPDGKPKTTGGGSVTPAALTKVDDTNVTLTLGGSPSTALLQATSLTLGWTGTLADSRIASAATWNAKQNAITLTTTGSSGPATLVGSTLNIPQYSGGGGGSTFGTHIVVKPKSSVYYSTNPLTGSGGTTTTTANNIYLAPFIPQNSISVNEFRVEVNTVAVGGLATILIFDDLNGLPKNKIMESTNLDCSTSGMKTYTASYSFVAGTVYWLGVSVNANIGFRSNNTSFALQHHASSSAVNPQYFKAFTFGSVPSSITISPNSDALALQPITIRFRAV